MTVSEIMRVYKMDTDRFETYSLGKGYEFFELLKDDGNNGFRYTKGEGKNAKYIGLFSNLFDLGAAVSYQSSNTQEFIGIKNELKKYNFKLYETDVLDQLNTLSKLVSYRNKIFEFVIVTIPKDNDLDRNYVTYQYTLKKF